MLRLTDNTDTPELTRSAKIGIAAVVVVVDSFVTEYHNRRERKNNVCISGKRYRGPSLSFLVVCRVINIFLVK